MEEETESWAQWSDEAEVMDGEVVEFEDAEDRFPLRRKGFGLSSAGIHPARSRKFLKISVLVRPKAEAERADGLLGRYGPWRRCAGGGQSGSTRADRTRRGRSGGTSHEISGVGVVRGVGRRGHSGCDSSPAIATVPANTTVSVAAVSAQSSVVALSGQNLMYPRVIRLQHAGAANRT
ncbi:MAG TPA: hypothetical protein VGX23_14750 [Actinocrinis sp.]|nr:hypothetical protein [Actinocrinis sp.]